MLGYIPCDEIKKQTSLNSFNLSVKNGSHKTSHADYAKFILMAPAFTFSVAINAKRFYWVFFYFPFISCHKCREILLGVFFTFLSLKRHGVGHIQHSNYRNDVVMSTFCCILTIINAFIFNAFILHIVYFLTWISVLYFQHISLLVQLFYCKMKKVNIKKKFKR